MSKKSLPDSIDLNSFRDSSDRFLYAKYRTPQEDYYYLKEGQYSRQGASWFTTNLKCPIDGCRSPELTVVPRHGDRREAFRHVQTPNHPREEFYSIQSVAMITRWLKERHPEAKIALDGSGYQIEVASPTIGESVIIVEYSFLSFDYWEKRNNMFLMEGVKPIWLFGHLSQNFPDWIPQMKQVKLPYLQEQMLDAGSKLLWINPVEEKVASILTETTMHACLIPSCKGKDKECMQTFIIEYAGKGNNSYFNIDPFTLSMLSEEGILTPSIKATLPDVTQIKEIRRVEEERAALSKPKISKSNNIQVDDEAQRIRREKIEEIIKNSPNIRELEEEKAKAKLDKRLKNNDKPSRTGYSCVVCGSPLDPMLKDTGRHLLC